MNVKDTQINELAHELWAMAQGVAPIADVVVLMTQELHNFAVSLDGQRDAEVERLRSQRLADAGFTRRPSLRAMEMRAALELIAAPMRADGTWNRDREACRQLAAEALGRYDDSETPSARVHAAP